MGRLLNALYTKQANLGRSTSSFSSDFDSRLSIGTLCLVMFVILWGAFVRITHSGAGCGQHWPLCKGEVIVISPTLDTLIEFTHRATSGISFLLVLFCLWHARNKSKSSLVKLSALLSFLFICSEAGIGAGLVLFGWVKDNSSFSRAIVVALHLANSLALLFFLSLQVFATTHKNINKFSLKSLMNYFRPYYLLIFMFTLVACAGAITALGDTLFPSTSLISGFMEDISPNSHFLIRLRVIHPFLACILAFLLLNFFISAPLKLEAKFANEIKTSCSLGILTLTVQILIGSLTVFLLAPSFLQLLHLFVSIVLWTTFCWTIFCLSLGTDKINNPLS